WVSTDNPTDVTTPDDDTINVNTAYDSTAQDETKQGYTFDGWYLDEDCTIPYVDGTVLTEDTILYGKWTKVTTSTDTSSSDDDTTTVETTSTTTSDDTTTETVETTVQTGDNYNVMLYALVLIIALLGIVTIKNTNKKKQ
ncbi:MAG: InlB B-repeat-containing protein, partial [Erysipelotrichaceae bacterium]|nr:InlB B-repeat-containing protein [Erysipelotrichaceae bacterium]